MHMPPTFLQMLGLPILQAFRREFPDIVIDVSSTYATGLPDREVDVAVIYDRPLVSDAVRDLLWMVRVTPVCSPEITARAAGLGLAGFLRGHELLHVRVDDRPRGMLWADFVSRCGIEVATDRGVSFDTAALAAQCAAAGVGVALADVEMFAGEIAAGRLAAPFPDVVLGDGYGYYLTFHPEDLADPVVALFRSWMIARFAAPAASPS
jgi:LysR family glycine cleavage system transcriptional activator